MAKTVRPCRSTPPWRSGTPTCSPATPSASRATRSACAPCADGRVGAHRPDRALRLHRGRFEVLGGTMGAAAGERVVRAYDRARELGCPWWWRPAPAAPACRRGWWRWSSSARTASAAERHARAGLLSVGVYGSPTTGGVLASYGSLVDLRAAYEHAVIGFAGPGWPRDPGHLAAGDVAHGRGAYQPRPGRRPGRTRARPPSGWTWPWARRAPAAHPARCRRGATRDAGRRLGRGPAGRARPAHRHRPCGPAGLVVVRAGRTDPIVRAGLATVAGRRCVVVATDRYHGGGPPTPAGSAWPSGPSAWPGGWACRW